MQHPKMAVFTLVSTIALATPALLAGCSKTSSSSTEGIEQPPEPPAMPSGWTVKQDSVIPPSQFPTVEGKLKGKLKALRNTVYDADGHRVQLNIIVPVDGAECDKVYRALANMKPQWAFARKADVIYEFVGNDAAAEQIKKARATLQP